ncbi:MAG: nucleotidyltransferase family protein [Burkholderiales bacterium]
MWNVRSGLPAEARIKDYDIFYFYPNVVTEEAEQLVQARIDDVVGDLGVVVEAKNQARVHHWYEEHFGHPYPELSSPKDGIDRFLTLSTRVGIRPYEQRFEVYAPNGFCALYEGSLVPNPLTDHSLLFERKARSYADRLPWLTISSPAPNRQSRPT